MRPLGKVFGVLIAMAALSQPTISNAQGNLFINGNFEANGGSFSGWAVQGNGFTLESGGPDGNDFAFHQGSSSPINYSELSTSINTSPGQNYVLTFSAIAFDGTNSASVSINNSLLASLNFTSTVPVNVDNQYTYNTYWQNFSFIFQATSPLTGLFFKYTIQETVIPEEDGFQYDEFYGAGGFANFSVTAAPEPTPVALLGAGLVGWLTCHKRARVKK
jgi:hypothetical protein